MKNNIGTLALASFCATAFAGTALAQDDMGGDWSAEGDMSGDLSADTSTDMDADASASSSVSADGGNATHTMGISVPLFESGLADLVNAFGGGGGGGGSADILYGLDADTWLDLEVGLNYGATTVDDGMGNQIQGDDVLGIEVGVGYRMYKPTKGRIRPYMQPGGVLAIGDFGNLGPSLSLGANILMGVDLVVMDQLTVGTAVGAGLTFTNEFETINLGLFTQNINATFWW